MSLGTQLPLRSHGSAVQALPMEKTCHARHPLLFVPDHSVNLLNK
jgi:hypothetical protein